MRKVLSSGLLALGFVLALASPAFAGVGDIHFVYYLAPIGGIVGLFMAFKFYKELMAQSEGTDDMVRIAQAVREGAYAYLGRQRNIVIIVFVILVGILIAIGFAGLQPQLSALGVPVAGFLSGLCGWFGMKTATNASARTTAAAKESLNSGLRVAFRAGAVMGLCVTGFALLDVSLWFFILNIVFGATEVSSLSSITTITISFAMGASLQALFARVGGGIYTKAADVGADLVGKVEAGIPEDDARNPATIADNVGDNVGDVAGMGADLYESYYGSILAAMALAAAAAMRLGLEIGDATKLVIVAPVLAGVGILASVASIFVVKTKEGASMKQLLFSLHSGVWASSALIILLSLGLLHLLLGGVEGVNPWGIWGAIIAGLLGGLVIAWGTEFYTSYEHGPTQRISEQSETGPATVIIAGIAEGMKSTWIPLLTVVVAIMCAFIFAGGTETFLMGVFGVGIAAVAMLSTLGITLATDAYGPIADNAGGNAEMTHQEPFVRERTDMLDSLGNTTAATGKGFAIGSAALTALALLAAYIITVQAGMNRQVEGFEVPAGQTVGYVDHGLFAMREGQGDDAKMMAGVVMDATKTTVTGKGTESEKTVETSVQADKVTALLNAQKDALKQATDDEGEVLPIVNGRATVVAADGDVTYTFRVAKTDDLALPQVLSYYNVTLMNPRVLCGLFLGVMLVFVFCAMTMNAVGRAAFAMMKECRRQFDIMKQAFKKNGMSDEDVADPQKWPYEVEADGKNYPDYANCVSISTTGALKEMVIPSLMAVIVPIAVGLVLGVAGVMGLLAGALVTGFAVAIFMANAGGAWDNAKKYIETGKLGGKGSDNHKATVVGDTVGDPFKDTSGPSLNILIKLVSVVSVVFAGVIVKFSPIVAGFIGLG